MATVAQYQERNAEILASINTLTEEKERLKSLATRSKELADSWENSIRPCPKFNLNRKKYQDCLADNKMRRDKRDGHKANYNSFIQSIKNIEDVQIPDLNEEYDLNLTLIDEAQMSEAEVSRLLAGQGLTYEGSTNKSTLEGEGNKESSILIGEAEAESILEHSDADTSNKKLMGYVGLGIGIVIVLTGIAIAIKKIKKA